MFLNKIFGLLGTFGYIWVHLGIIEYSWLFLTTFNYFWRLLATFGHCWLLLNTFGYFVYFWLHLASFSYLCTFWHFFVLLVTFGSSSVLLGTFGTTSPIFTKLSPSPLKKYRLTDSLTDWLTDVNEMAGPMTVSTVPCYCFKLPMVVNESYKLVLCIFN